MNHVVEAVAARWIAVVTSTTKGECWESSHGSLYSILYHSIKTCIWGVEVKKKINQLLHPCDNCLVQYPNPMVGGFEIQNPKCVRTLTIRVQ